jgi:hypothetical protein
MKHAIKACWRRSLALAAAVPGALAVALWVALSLVLPPGNAATEHVLQAELLTASGGSFAPLPQTLADVPTGPWQVVSLPHTWPQPLKSAGNREMRVTWLQIRLDDLPATQGPLVMYLPRWQTIGRIAVYGDDRLLYRSVGDVVWNAFN